MKAFKLKVKRPPAPISGADLHLSREGISALNEALWNSNSIPPCIEALGDQLRKLVDEMDSGAPNTYFEEPE